MSHSIETYGGFMKERCRALDEGGRRCRNKAIGDFAYHGDGEIYNWTGDPRPNWVLVPLCRKHKGKEEPYKRPR